MSFDDLESIVKVRNLRFDRNTRIILNDLNLDIPKGKITAIMGPSGCGKTTLLRLLGGQLVPDQGQVLVEDKDLATLSRDGLYKLRERMGMLFQSGALFSDLSVYDNVAFPIREHTNLPEDMIRDLVFMKLQAVGLRGTHSLMPAALSGGMARRVALARAIALDPDIIMYDEPFTGQDPISKAVLVKLIKMISETLGITSVLVSHDIHETISIADNIYLLANGKVVGSGDPESILDSDNEWVKQFMQGFPDGPVPFHYPARDYAADLQLDV